MNKSVRQALITEFDRRLHKLTYERIRQGDNVVYRRRTSDGYSFLQLVIPGQNRFTIEIAQSQSETYPHGSTSGFTTGEEWRGRIGHLLGHKLDLWWNFDDTASLDFDAIVHDLENPEQALRQVLPAVDQAMTAIVQVQRALGV